MLFRSEQTIGVILGFAIGSTLTVQVISFASTASGFALGPVVTGLVLTMGFLLRTLARYRRAKALGSALFGVGLLFLGLQVMGQAFAELTPGSANALDAVLRFRVLAFIVGLVLGATVRSVAACGLVMMASASGLSLHAAIPIVLGANVGTCLVPLLVGVRVTHSAEYLTRPTSRPEAGLQVALAELALKLTGALVFLLLLQPFAALVVRVTETLNFGLADIPGRQVAHAHTLFNLTNALVFLPLASPFAALMRKLVPSPRVRAAKSALLFVRPSQEQDPEISLQQTHSEVERMARMAVDLLQRAFDAVLSNDHGELERVEADDERIDLLDTVLTEFLVRLPAGEGQSDASDETAGTDAPWRVEMRSKLLGLVKNFESLADLATRDLVTAGRRKAIAGYDFSPEAAADLKRFGQRVTFGCEQMLRFLHDGTGDIESVLAFERDVDGFKLNLLDRRSEEHTSELQSHSFISYAVFCLKKKK